MDSKKSQEMNHNASEQRHVDAPPSYSEAMGNTHRPPTAPTLETQSTNPSANSNVFPQNQYAPRQGPSAFYDPRFDQWDERATRILMTNRLRMNEQFARAKSKQDEDLLWNLILIELINDGYTNLMLYDLVEYWRFQFHIYCIVRNGLSSNVSDNWQYFEPMHSVFGGNSGANFTTNEPLMLSGAGYVPGFGITPGSNYIPGSMSTNYAPTLLPNPVITPTPIIHQSPIVTSSSDQVAETPSTLPNNSAPTSVDAPASTPGVASTVLQPSDIPSSADAAVAGESVPLLEQQSSGNSEANGLLSTSTGDVGLPADAGLELAAASAASPTGLGDIASDATTTNLLSGNDSSNNILSSGVITSQPSESLVPTLLGDDVITTQPTFSSPPLTTGVSADGDGCCGCCNDDGCCSGGAADDGCCGGNDDCCGDVDCCAGCDDCGDCGDCDLG